MTHHKTTRIWYRRLAVAWEATENNRQRPDPLIRELFKAVINDAAKRRSLKGVLTCKHSLEGKGVMLTQKYRVTGFGRVVLLPPPCCPGLDELPSGLFKL